MEVEKNLVYRLQTYQDEAWDEFVDAFYGKLIAFCRHSVRYEDEAEDMVQDIFFKAKNSIGGLTIQNDEKGTIHSWLWTIARNTIRDYYRKQRLRDDRIQPPQPSQTATSQMIGELRDDKTGPRTNAKKQDRHKLLFEALDALDPKYADVIFMRFIDGFSRRRMAEIC